MGGFKLSRPGVERVCKGVEGVLEASNRPASANVVLEEILNPKLGLWGFSIILICPLYDPYIIVASILFSIIPIYPL